MALQQKQEATPPEGGALALTLPRLDSNSTEAEYRQRLSESLFSLMVAKLRTKQTHERDWQARALADMANSLSSKYNLQREDN